MRIRARHYQTGQPIELTHDGRLIQSVTASAAPAAPAESVTEAGWVAPALFDLQINGCEGHSFNSERLTVEMVRHVVEVCHRHGIGALCPTLVTNAFPALRHGIATVRRACE